MIPGLSIRLSVTDGTINKVFALSRYEKLPNTSSSLSPNRYAVSVIWEMDGESLEVLDVWYGRTIIRSAYKMTYKAAQTITDLKGIREGEGGEPNGERILTALGGDKAVGELVPELANLKKVDRQTITTCRRSSLP